MVGRPVADDDLDLRQRGDADEGDAAQLALVRRDDHPVGAPARRPLHPALGLVVVGDPAFTIDAGDTHHVGVAVVVGQGVLGARSDQAQLSGAQLAAGQHDGGTGLVDQGERGEHAGRHHGQAQSATLERVGDGQRGAARVEDQGLVDADQVGHHVGDVDLLLGGIGHPGRERRLGILALQRDRAADDPAQDTEGLQRLDIAPDRHLRDVELGGQLRVVDLAGGPHAVLDPRPARLHIHGDSGICSKFTDLPGESPGMRPVRSATV